jgi:RNA 3'-terminal phosphate cyclase
VRLLVAILGASAGARGRSAEEVAERKARKLAGAPAGGK